MKKLFTMILSFAMAFSIITLPASAKGTNDTPYYVAMGDSVAAGYSLPNTDRNHIGHVKDNCKDDISTTYPHIVAEKIKQFTGYEGDLYDHYSNIATVSARIEDVTGLLTDEDYYPPYIPYIFDVTIEDCQLHNLYVQEISKADLISVHVGNNDMISDATIQIQADGVGSDAIRTTYNGMTVYDNVKNPLLTIVYDVMSKVGRGTAFTQDELVSIFTT